MPLADQKSLPDLLCQGSPVTLGFKPATIPSSSIINFWSHGFSILSKYRRRMDKFPYGKIAIAYKTFFL